jgi:hypothetical protein
MSGALVARPIMYDIRDVNEQIEKEFHFFK